MYNVNWFLDHVIASGFMIVGVILLFFPIGNLGRLAVIFSLMKLTPRNSIGGLHEGIVAFEGNAFASDQPILDERGESCAYLSVSYEDKYGWNIVAAPSPFFLVGDETGTVAVEFRHGFQVMNQLISMALGLLLMAVGTYIRKIHQGS